MLRLRSFHLARTNCPWVPEWGLCIEHWDAMLYARDGDVSAGFDGPEWHANPIF